MKIYTRKGDAGKTSLIGGVRVAKDNVRIEAYGTIDELNSYIGLVRDVCTDIVQAELLYKIQNTLFDIGSHLAAHPEKSVMKLPDINQNEIDEMEQQMDIMNDQMPPLAHFILPGGHVHVSYCHLARTVCRRAERHIVSLNKSRPVESLIMRYINRLSDYLFVLGRYYAHLLQVAEIMWIPER
ncbi:MAG: cob(I)yrinic acid a,c-diamide adenosyltransferase [Bacteroidota bacterium]|nr:cob(I)yrinic acid a,c-diamide adenosyltransferase [Bacteroidota bacterium]